jgi:hypothetical protein
MRRGRGRRRSMRRRRRRRRRCRSRRWCRSRGRRRGPGWRSCSRGRRRGPGWRSCSRRRWRGTRRGCGCGRRCLRRRSLRCLFRRGLGLSVRAKLFLRRGLRHNQRRGLRMRWSICELHGGKCGRGKQQKTEFSHDGVGSRKLLATRPGDLRISVRPDCGGDQRRACFYF